MIESLDFVLGRSLQQSRRRNRFRTRTPSSVVRGAYDVWDTCPLETFTDHVLSRSESQVTIADLPDDVICLIYGGLAGTFGLSGGLNVEAISFSQTCRRMNEIFRRLFVSRIRCGGGAMRSQDIPRALLRFPAASQLNVTKTHSKPTNMVDILGTNEPGTRVGPSRLTNLSVLDVSLPSSQVLAISTYCPFLRKLSLVSCRNLSDDGIRSVLRRLSPHLREVSLKNSFSYSDSLSDQGICVLGQLPFLSHVDISGVPNFPRTFSSLGNLSNLLSLNISQSKVETHSLATPLSGLKHLTTLDISQTPYLTPSILASLPTSLSTLKASMCAAICDETDPGLLRNLPNLRNLTLRLSKNGLLTSLAPILLGARYLNSLDLSQSAFETHWDADVLGAMPNLELLKLENCDIPEWPLRIAKSLTSLQYLTVSGSRGMESEMENIAYMKGLRHLKLCGCHNVGNPTAFAIASLPHLETLSMTSTMIDENGAKAISNGVCQKTLRLFRLHHRPKRRIKMSRAFSHSVAFYRESRFPQ